jgi:hypothetical protein
MVSRIENAKWMAVVALWFLALAAWGADPYRLGDGARCVIERNDLRNTRVLKCCTPNGGAGGNCRFEALAEPVHGKLPNTAFIKFTGGSSF